MQLQQMDDLWRNINDNVDGELVTIQYSACGLIHVEDVHVDELTLLQVPGLWWLIAVV